VFVQFSDATAGGASAYPMNSTSGLVVNLATDSSAGSLNGWGWQNGAYWLGQTTTVSFPTTGTHTLRVQVREDGVELDQIVLSPGQFLTAAPGPVSNDSTIVPKP
jgi:Gylcosyl hydrolase family 115 C-terminal domain